jgi:hypothetical protein
LEAALALADEVKPQRQFVSKAHRQIVQSGLVARLQLQLDLGQRQALIGDGNAAFIEGHFDLGLASLDEDRPSLDDCLELRCERAIPNKGDQLTRRSLIKQRQVRLHVSRVDLDSLPGEQTIIRLSHFDAKDRLSPPLSVDAENDPVLSQISRCSVEVERAHSLGAGCRHRCYNLRCLCSLEAIPVGSELDLYTPIVVVRCGRLDDRHVGNRACRLGHGTIPISTVAHPNHIGGRNHNSLFVYSSLRSSAQPVI